MNSQARGLAVDEIYAVLGRMGKGCAWFDTQYRLLSWNDVFLQLNEFPAELVAHNVSLDELSRFRVERGDTGVCDANRPDQDSASQNESVLTTGEQRTVSGRTLRILSYPVAQRGLLQIYEDITPVRNAEVRLAQSEERYDFAMRAINEGVYDWDLTNGSVYYSTRVREALDLSPEQLRNAEDWGNRIHPDDLPAFRAAYVAHVKGETERFECDMRYRADDGTWRWARQHGLALRDESGRACRIIGSTGDITELKRAELELRRTQEALEGQNQRLRSEIEAHRRSQATIEYLVDEIRSDHRFGDIVGQSPAIHQLMARVELVAETESTVLLLGETGTGKELIARTVHELGRRHEKPLVKVNCAALPRDLVESELFGHEKGAFTGATQLRRGRFELADGGTLFLDEVGELPLEAQAKLLRVLQEREFERVGGSRSLRTDVRLIAATNRDLGERVESGQFRSDLYYRLNVFPITIPPLRERREDIPLLIQHFLQRFAHSLGKAFAGVAADFLEQAQRYDWPGNIRELENIVERGAILSRGSTLQLPESLVAVPGPPARADDSCMEAQDLSLEAVERGHIERVLSRTGGTIEGVRGAAGILGLKPSTLRSRMRKLGISR